MTRLCKCSLSVETSQGRFDNRSNYQEVNVQKNNCFRYISLICLTIKLYEINFKDV